MMIEQIVIDGCDYEFVTVDQALEIGATQAEIDAALEAQNPTDGEDVLRAKAKIAIDKAAGQARNLVAGTVGDLIDVEYKLTEEQAKAWDAAGRPVDNVPEWVSCWANVTGKTNSEACDDILAKSEAWTAALMRIRTARLSASHEVMTCPVNEINQHVQAFIQGLSNLA